MHATVKTLAAVSGIAMVLGTGFAAVNAADMGTYVGNWWYGPNPGTQFREYIAHRYTVLAAGEEGDMDIHDPIYLSNAAVNALDGGPIMPHPLEGVLIVSSQPGELQTARDFLVNVAQHGAADKLPRSYANALSAFDCWTEQQQSEPNASHNLQQCKRIYQHYAANLAELYGANSQQVTMNEHLRTLHSVYFAWNHSDLTPQARRKLDAAHTMLTDVNNGKLIISGFADTSGSPAYNQKLSEKRARTVANYLNLPEDRFEIRVRAFGERELHVPTADGMRTPLNRVVDISVRANRTETGYMSK